MNVLIVDDRGSTTYFMERWFKENGHNVLSAFNPNEAQYHWSKRDEVPIHCVTLDLQMPTIGLSNEQKERSLGGTLSGWIWLHDNVLTEMPEMRQRTIIYSDYSYILCENVPEDEYRGITIVPKKQRQSAAEYVVARFQEIARMAR